jgi:DNA-binding IclR family transcriptional regulator
LQTAALPELFDLANELAMTSFLVVRDGDEAVTMQSVEPRHSAVHVAYRPGVRHPVDRGAPGIALLGALPPVAGERPEVTQARQRGWAWSSGEVLPGMRSVSAPVVGRRGEVLGAAAVVYVESAHSVDAIGVRVVAGARAIARELP